MKQYRIVEHTQGDTFYYTIQEYKWFIFFYWSTITECGVCNDGYGPDSVEKRFPYISTAEAWLYKLEPKTTKVVKHITSNGSKTNFNKD